MTSELLPISMLVLAAAILVAYFLTSRSSRKKKKKHHASSHPSRRPGDPSASSHHGSRAASLRPEPVKPLPSLDSYDDAPTLEVEVTQMGELPPEVLEAIQGKLSGDLPLPDEEAMDVQLDELVDETAPEEVTGASAIILVTGIARSDRGMKRRCNEDAFLCLPEEPLFVVCDGMGGHAAGDVASSTAVKVMEEAFKSKTFENAGTRGWPRRGDELVCAIEMANRAIFRIAKEREIADGMGTTAVAVRFASNKQRAYIAHVGDSRCYRIRDGAITQLTEDHTLGNLLGIKGKVGKHLARSVGIAETVAVDLTVEKPAAGDFYLICSDGLNKMLPDKDIERLFLYTSGTLDDKARSLIDEANRRGGQDNITIIAVGIENAKFG